MLTIDTISAYNDLHDFKTQHPQVAFARFTPETKRSVEQYEFGLYALFLKETKGCVINYGMTQYDFDAQTVVSFAPGQQVGYTTLEGVPVRSIGIVFHPSFIQGTPLEKKMKRYSYFAYSSNEALHLSEDEVQTLRHSMEWIEQELAHPIDKFSKELIVTNLELIMDYCLRFYERQFITRKALNVSTLERFSELLSKYLLQGEAATHGVPTVRYFAQRIHLSPNYLGDLVKTETGYSAQEFIAQRLVQYAERQLQDEQLSVKEIALQAGFRHPQHFVRFFKKHTSLTPTDFRAQTSAR